MTRGRNINSQGMMGQIRAGVCCGLLWFVIITFCLVILLSPVWIFPKKLLWPGEERGESQIPPKSVADCVWANLCCEVWVVTWVLTMFRPCFGIQNIYKLTGGPCLGPSPPNIGIQTNTLTPGRCLGNINFTGADLAETTHWTYT